MNEAICSRFDRKRSGLLLSMKRSIQLLYSSLLQFVWARIIVNRSVLTEKVLFLFYLSILSFCCQRWLPFVVSPSLACYFHLKTRYEIKLWMQETNELFVFVATTERWYLSGNITSIIRTVSLWYKKRLFFLILWLFLGKQLKSKQTVILSSGQMCSQ